ncbi:putative target SNARE coiled-coil domain-containing protein [Rosa chinensis]|uniref:Putative target SNARE coiled-coil domain-containing protein n=1 Tax=Rosa chinensis TaxID=74649 RepID=A0A2P6R2L8_ROSCH|nr:putative SNAP25 homologous protein SNAP30 [Rosa chinensis]PRQ40680.1 putative target SNARE coiled-coil domain-containing protein [Rosa chinensis]
MFGFLKSPAKIAKQSSVDPGSLDSETQSNEAKITPARRTTSEPVLITPDFGNEKPGKPSTRGTSPASYKNDFHDSGGLENQSVQELEKYAVYKSEETTQSVNNCLRIAEDIKGTATTTLDTLHQQGDQITRTHMAAVDMDKDLSKGEKLLNGLGGIFSKPWKPKKTKELKGPELTADSATTNKRASKEQREKLGLSPAPKGSRSAPETPLPEGSSAIQQIEAEKAKQDDALSDLSNILGDLKGMAVDMGSELERQNKAMDHLSEDVDELNSRMKGANQRTRRLLGQ